VESVAWISERKDVLSTLFWLLAMLAWVGYAHRPAVGRYVGVTVLFLFGLLSKPMVITLPFTLLLLDAWPLGRAGTTGTLDRKRLVRLVAEKIPLLGVAAAFAVVTWLAQAGAGATLALARIPPGARAANAAVSYVAYLGDAFWPAGLAAFYPHPAITGEATSAWKVAGSVVVLLAVSGVALGAWRRRPYLAWGWTWYLGTLLPVIGLVQVGGQAMADRYTYVPLLGILVAVVWWTSDVAAERGVPARALQVAAVVAVAALAVVATRQVSTWRDSIALHSHAIAVTDRNWLAWRSLGDAYAGEGRYQEALPAYQESLRIFPGLAEGWNGVGVSLGGLGRHTEAVSQFREAVRLNPQYGRAWINLGSAYANLGDFPEAVRCLREGLRWMPESAQGWNMLGLAALGMGDVALAEYSVQNLVPIDPKRAAELRRRIAAHREGR
jgi:hypothetical protein